MICYLDSIRLSHSIAYSIDERYENKRYENETHFRNSVYYNCVLNLFEIVIHCIHSYPQTLSYIIWKYLALVQKIGVCYREVSAIKHVLYREGLLYYIVYLGSS